MLNDVTIFEVNAFAKLSVSVKIWHPSASTWPGCAKGRGGKHLAFWFHPLLARHSIPLTTSVSPALSKRYVIFAFHFSINFITRSQTRI